jgi:3-oxoadipate enol-lactonase
VNPRDTAATTETLVRGNGEPVTVFAHGMGGGIPDTRPLGSAVDGSKVFYTALGHDGAETGNPFGYAELARQLGEIADKHSARRALGISMGAGALCRLLCEQPDRFDKVVFFLPAVLDEPRDAPATGRLAALDRAMTAGDTDTVTDWVLADLPVAVRQTPAARVYADTRARRLCRPALRGLAIRLAAQVAVPDPAALSRVRARALVLGCRDDAAHPASVAERLAALLPHAEQHIYDRPDVVWSQRADLRARVAGFLND